MRESLSKVSYRVAKKTQFQFVFVLCIFLFCVEKKIPTFWICSVARSDSPKMESAREGATTGAASFPGTLCTFSQSGVSNPDRLDTSSSSSSHRSLSCQDQRLTSRESE